jgi:hypothetical protein
VPEPHVGWLWSAEGSVPTKEEVRAMEANAAASANCVKGRKLHLLDVGSCYNPFKDFDGYEVRYTLSAAVESHPALPVCVPFRGVRGTDAPHRRWSSNLRHSASNFSHVRD